MNWDQIEGIWKQYSGKIKEKWGKPTDHDCTAIQGKRHQLVGLVEERYGIAKDLAEKEVDEFSRSLHDVDVPERRKARKPGASGRARRMGKSGIGESPLPAFAVFLTSFPN